MQGVADGSGIDYRDILQLNLFPEMFHCSGVTVANEATKDGDLYHVRVLDYDETKGVQKTAALIISEPDDDRYAHLNVSYAGFIGSVTGMNVQKIALGEIGGWGYGHWDGMPMPFLMREVLENASTLEEAKQIFADARRTCEYYYVLSDGKTKESVALYATASQIHFIAPGSSYALLAPKDLPQNYGMQGDNDKFFLSDYQIDRTSFQLVLRNEENDVLALFHQQPKYCLVLTGFARPYRYPVLIKRLVDQFSILDENALQEVIKPPVTRETNLHNAIFKPSELKVWIAHAGPNGEPAADQPYQFFCLSDFFKTENIHQP
jgi:isopenicillin-N N-acyltransferase like protein